jgi:glyoxylase-like metal-dependent hydrolase (beta-lactamase superfamily II)
MAVAYDVISIGCLSRNRLWGEKEPVRAAHATTTLIRDKGLTLLVDPSLPAELLRRLLNDRAGLTPERVDTVFLTTFRPIHRRGLPLFDHATWLMSAAEIEAVREHLEETRERGGDDAEVRRIVDEELAVLKRVQPAPDKLSPQVDLFPAPGASAGSAALLLVPPGRTVAVAGDAVLTREHYEQGQVFDRSFDAQRAQESFVELAEIADVVVPGHDNVFMPLR